MREHRRPGMCFGGRLVVDSVAINLNYQDDSVLEDYKIGLDPAIQTTAAHEHGQRR